MTDLEKEILARVDKWCAKTGRSRAYVAKKVAQDARLFRRIEAGGTMTLKMYDRIEKLLEAPYE